MRQFAAVGLAVVVLALVLTGAQEIGDSTLPAFEVASLKRAESGGPPGDIPRNMDNSPGHFAMRNVPLRYAIEWAFDCKDYQIAGPEWIKADERFNIEARADGLATNDQMRSMLKRLLIERLRMKLHRETKDLAVYALVRGKGEPKLKPAPADEQPHLAGSPTGAEFHKFALSRLTFLLTRRMDRPVLDLTGLNGEYDYTIDLTGLGDHPGSTGDDGPGPSVFSAVQSDLGLKLEARKHPVEIIVIDSVSKVPIEN